MKQVLWCLLICGICYTAHAEDETLFPSSFIHGGYGAPVLKFTTVNNEPSVFGGIRGGWIINHRLSLGMGFYGNINEIDGPRKAARFYGRDLEINIGYGGVEMGWIFSSHRLVHLECMALIGYGGIEYNEDMDANEDFDKHDGAVVFEPCVAGELNVTKNFRLSAGLSYRMFDGLEMYDMNGANAGGMALNLALKCGSF